MAGSSGGRGEEVSSALLPVSTSSSQIRLLLVDLGGFPPGHQEQQGAGAAPQSPAAGGEGQQMEALGLEEVYGPSQLIQLQLMSVGWKNGEWLLVDGMMDHHTPH